MRKTAALAFVLACAPAFAQTLLADLQPGWGLVHAVTPVGSCARGALFLLNDGVTSALWRTDGTGNGTVVVSDLIDAPAQATVASISLGGVCLFGVESSGAAWLWRSDGTAAGTQRLARTEAAEFVVLGRRAYFRGGPTELWASDGSPAGTALVATTPDQPRQLCVADNRVLFLCGADLWESDGTPARTRAATSSADVAQIVAWGDGVALSRSRGVDLYRPATATMTNVHPAAAPLRLLGSVGGRLLFEAGTTTRSLDRAGTLRSLPVPQGGYAARQVCGRLVYLSSDNRSATQISAITTDGLNATVVALGVDNRTPLQSVDVGDDRVSFVLAATPAIRTWLSDGGAGSGFMAIAPDVRLLHVGAGDACSVGVYRDRLALICGPASATEFVQFPGRGHGSAPVSVATRGDRGVLIAGSVLGTRAFGTAGTGATLGELGIVDPHEVVATERRFYVAAGSKLFASDTTRNSAREIADLGSGAPQRFVARGDRAFGFDAPFASGLVRIDGDDSVLRAPFSVANQVQPGELIVTARGAYAVARNVFGSSLEVLPHAGRACQSMFAAPEAFSAVGCVGGRLLLSRPNGLHALDEASGIVTFLGAAFTGATIAFPGFVLGANGTSLWRSDGTPAGSFVLRSTPSYLFEAAALPGDRVLFAHADAGNGEELWITDGTVSGTRLLADLRPGSDSSAPRSLTTIGTLVVFSADTDRGRRELWASDGTAAGTRLVADVAPVGGSNPRAFAALGSRLLFWADEQVFGDEPRTLPMRALGAAVSSVLGSGCAPFEVRALAPAILGDASFALSVAVAPGALAVGLLGTSSTTQSVTLGHRTCDLRVADPLLVLAATVSGQTARIALPIPPRPELLGSAWIAQFAVGDPSLGSAVSFVIGR